MVENKEQPSEFSENTIQLANTNTQGDDAKEKDAEVNSQNASSQSNSENSVGSADQETTEILIDESISNDGSDNKDGKVEQLKINGEHLKPVNKGVIF